MAAPREDVEQALARAVEIAGPRVLQEPMRLQAIVADLVGQPDSDHRDEIGAIRAVADVMTNSGLSDEKNILAELNRQGAGADAGWAISTLNRHGATIVSRRSSTDDTPVWRRPWAVASMVIALVAVPVILVVLPNPGPSPNDDTTTDESTPDTGDSTVSSDPEPPPPEPSPEVVGYDVAFDEGVEGLLVAERTWVIQDGQVTGTIVLTPTAESGIAQHRELVPSVAFSDPVFTPEPTSVSGDIASFSIDQSAGDVMITFEATLTTANPDQATVESWTDDWRQRAASLRPVDNEPPADATVTPRYEPAG